MSHATRTSESCPTYEWVMSHVWKPFANQQVMNESCHVYTRVTSHVWASHVTHISHICVWFENQMRGDLFPVQRMQHTAAMHCNTLQLFANQTRDNLFAIRWLEYHIVTHCNTLQRTATHCKHTANTLQHTATHRNTRQHTATHCNHLQIKREAICFQFADSLLQCFDLLFLF